MRDRLGKLMTVKSIVTVCLTAIFSALALRGTITGDQFLTVFAVVISFYFGTQAERRANRDGDEV